MTLKRREFLTLIGGAAAAWPVAARAQQPSDRMRRVAFLSVGAEDVARTAAFRDGLAKFGWIEGRNLHIELRFSGDSDADTRRHASELVNLAPDVIVTRGGFATLVMKQLTRTIPIVMAGAGDPIAAGLLKDMAHPEGNITGVTNRVTSINGKMLELLKEAAPGVRRMAILQPDISGSGSFAAQIDEAARALAVQVVYIPYRSTDGAIAEYVEKGRGDPAALREWCDQWEGMEAEVALIAGAEAKWKAKEPPKVVEPGAGWDNGRIRLWCRDRGVDPGPWLEKAREARRKQAEPEPVSEEEEAPGAGAAFFGPEAQPEVEDEPEAEREPGWLPKFASEKSMRWDPENNPVVLSSAGPYDNAREWARRFAFREAMLAMFWWHGEFWRWDGHGYEPVNDAELTADVFDFLDRSVRVVAGKDGSFTQGRFRPTVAQARDLIAGLKAGLALKADFDPAAWLDTGRGAGAVLAFRNGVVNVRSGEFGGPTPKLWMHGTAGYEWNEGAKAVVWEGLLEAVFPGDGEAHDCVEEWLGYNMTEDVRFQKGMLWVGRPRSGKGTLAGVIRGLVGAGAYAGLTLHNWIMGENSRQKLIGKRALVFPDVRPRPGKLYGQNWDPGGVDHASAELLLNITGGDAMDIPRKYVGAWHGTLVGKVTMVSNEVPNFNDAVLPSRFVKLAFDVSFAGREDIRLPGKLATELPGIAARCVRAYRRLLARGRFIQPRSGLALKDGVAAGSDPLTEFVRRNLVADPGGEIECGKLFTMLGGWLNAQGRLDVVRALTPSNLTSKLQRIEGLANIRTLRPHDQPRVYLGVRWKTKEERRRDGDE
jgi:putative DNA primase/helicase